MVADSYRNRYPLQIPQIDQKIAHRLVAARMLLKAFAHGRSRSGAPVVKSCHRGQLVDMLSIVSIVLSPSKGRLPANISYNTTPSEKMSER